MLMNWHTSVSQLRPACDSVTDMSSMEIHLRCYRLSPDTTGDQMHGMLYCPETSTKAGRAALRALCPVEDATQRQYKLITGWRDDQAALRCGRRPGRPSTTVGSSAGQPVDQVPLR